MSRPESLNNPETQNNSPSQQRDYSVYVNKYENYHKNYSNAQELINKQSIDIQQSQEQKELER
ncbi:MAG: hypothetical protein LBU14_00660 [Candidatus Peribacteria bacterium]|jgi:hypothetical protein|nr:hypothetical protein [Candidatus Peribacteria bacterium]